MVTQDDVLKPEEVAAILRVSLRFIYRQIHAGVIPHVKIGDRYLISRVALNRWLEGNTREGGYDR